MKNNKSSAALVFVSIAFAISSCRQGSPADKGKKLFTQTTLTDQPGCITCHSLEPNTIIIGQSVAGIGVRAGNIIPGMSAQAYLRESILDPNAYLAPGFPEDTMPPVWEERLSPEQVDQLVAYLMTLN